MGVRGGGGLRLGRGWRGDGLARGKAVYWAEQGGLIEARRFLVLFVGLEGRRACISTAGFHLR